MYRMITCSDLLGWKEVPVKINSKLAPSMRTGYECDLGDGYYATVYPENHHNKSLPMWVATIYKDGHVDSFETFRTADSAKHFVEEF